MDMPLLINLMLTMLVMLLVGYLLARLGVIDAKANASLNRFAMTAPQCATVLARAINMDRGMTVGTVLGVMGAGLAMYLLLIALGLLVPRILGVPRGDRGLYSVLTIFGNTGYMGLPLATAILGNTAGFYAALVTVPCNLFAFTLGIRLLGGPDEKFDWRKMLNPALVSSVLAAVLVFIPIPWPRFVKDATTYFGDMILPLSMTIVGASLGSQRLRDVFADWKLYIYSPAKLLVAPVLLWAVMRLFISDGTLLATLTLLGATPCGAIAVMLSLQYGGNEKLATRAVFLTTVLSAATISLVCWLLL